MTKDLERADEDDYDRAAELIDDTLNLDGLVEVIIEREGLRGRGYAPLKTETQSL